MGRKRKNTKIYVKVNIAKNKHGKRIPRLFYNYMVGKSVWKQNGGKQEKNYKIYIFDQIFISQIKIQRKRQYRI